MLNWLFRLVYPHQNPAVINKKYHIPNKLNFKFKIKDGYLVATSPELPGLVTQAKTPEELLEMVNDAILTYYDVPRREADIIHNKLNLDGYGTITLGEKFKTVSA